MRIAVISDIHGNMEALNEVLLNIATAQIGAIYCLGDIIGYGPDSEQVVQTIRSRAIPTIMGNHELVIKKPKYFEWFNPVARKSVKITMKSLSSEAIQYVSKFELFMVDQDCRFVHGFPPKSALTYLFQVADEKKKRVLKNLQERICFVGHTHLLEYVACNEETIDSGTLEEGITDLTAGKKYFINVGSVGQPRDGNNQAKYVIYDSERDQVDVRFVSYDVQKVITNMLKAGLPREHADRLR